MKAKIPIFALVEQAVYEQFHVYNHNKANKSIDPAKITYPSVDSHKIFDFIGEVHNSDEARYTKTRNHFIKRLTNANLTTDDFIQKNETESASSEANMT